MDKVFDVEQQRDYLAINSMNFEFEAGLHTEVVRLKSYDEVQQYLIKRNYITPDEMQWFDNTNFQEKPDDMEEILFCI